MVGSPYRRASGTDCVDGLRLDYRVKPDTEHAADASLDLWTQHGTVGGGNEAGAGLKWRWWRDDGGSPRRIREAGSRQRRRPLRGHLESGLRAHGSLRTTVATAGAVPT